MKLIYNPKLDREPGSRPLRFSRPSNKPITDKGKKATNNLEPVELIGTWITPGINELPQEEWEFIASLEETNERIMSGVFRPLFPTVLPDEISGSLSDFSSSDAKEIILNTWDIDWLQLTSNQDPRKEVQKWCLERIKALRSMNKLA